MNGDNIFKYDITLQKLSTFAVAVSFWERPDVIKLIDDNFSSGFVERYYKPEISRDSTSSSGQKVLDHIFKQLNLLKFPEKLINQIEILVIKIGEKICFWRRYVVTVLKIDVKWARKIFWTASGEIDEVKIFQDIWVKGGAFIGLKCSCCMNKYLFCMACLYAQENFVFEHFKEMSNGLLLHFSEKRTPELTSYGVLATWIIFCDNINVTDALKEFESLNKQQSELPAKDLFLKCVERGYEFGARYFLNRLTVNEKQTLLAKTAVKVLNLDFGQSRFRRDVTLKREAAAKLIFFLVNEMSMIQKLVFISKHSVKLFEFFMKSSWPYQELCEKILDVVAEHGPDQQEELLKILIKEFDETKSKDSTIFLAGENFYINLMQILMGRVSKELKEEIFLDKPSVTEKINNYIENEDYVFLKLIINDSDLKAYKGKILNLAKEQFIKYVQEGEYDDVNEFLEIMKLPKEELSSFKESLNLLSSFLIGGDFDLAKKHLDWLKEEDIIIDVVEICSILIHNNKLETADEFLNWLFPDDEELQKRLKEGLKTDKIIRDQIFEIWCCVNPLHRYDIETLTGLSEKLLNWFFDSEEEIIEFKKTKSEIENIEEFISKYYDMLYYEKSFFRLSDFLRFWSLSNDDITSIRNQIAGNINYWINTLAFEKGNIKMTNSLLNWVYAKSSKEKAKVIRDYMNSPRGPMLCVKIFKNYSAKDHGVIIKFFNEWITECTQLSAIQLQLTGLEGTGRKKKIFSHVEKVLEKGIGRCNENIVGIGDIFESDDSCDTDGLNDSYESESDEED